MYESIQPLIQALGETLDIVGVILILLGFILASVRAVYRYFHPLEHETLFHYYRRQLAKAILIGLEFLVAGDIIRTVAGELTLQGVAALGGIVIIRTILAMTLEHELQPQNALWPWRKKK